MGWRIGLQRTPEKTTFTNTAEVHLINEAIKSHFINTLDKLPELHFISIYKHRYKHIKSHINKHIYKHIHMLMRCKPRLMWDRSVFSSQPLWSIVQPHVEHSATPVERGS